MSANSLDAIMLLWNGAGLVRTACTSLRRQTRKPTATLLIDNASSDGCLALAAGFLPSAETLRNEENIGFPRAMNAGMAKLRGDIVVLLNQDIELDPRCFEQIARAFDSDPRIGAVGCKLLFPDRMTIQHAGGYLEEPLLLAQHYGHGELDFAQWDEARPVQYVTGAVIGLRRAALQDVGLFDERFSPGYFEEAELCLRLADAGWTVWYEPSAVAVHFESASIRRNSHAYFLAYHRSRLRLALKRGVDWPAFAEAERGRFVGIGLERERRILASLYRLLEGEAASVPAAAAVWPMLRDLATSQWIDDLDYRAPLASHPERGSIRQVLRTLVMASTPPEDLGGNGIADRVIRSFKRARWRIGRLTLQAVAPQQRPINRLVLDALDRLDPDIETLIEASDDSTKLRSLLGSLTERVGQLERVVRQLESEAAGLRVENAELRHRPR